MKTAYKKAKEKLALYDRMTNEDHNEDLTVEEGIEYVNLLKVVRHYKKLKKAIKKLNL